MTDPTGFVPPGSPFVFVVPDPGTLAAPDPTGFVPACTPFAFIVPDGPERRETDNPPRHVP
jgi:hypothetical protein